MEGYWEVIWHARLSVATHASMTGRIWGTDGLLLTTDVTEAKAAQGH